MVLFLNAASSSKDALSLTGERKQNASWRESCASSDHDLMALVAAIAKVTCFVLAIFILRVNYGEIYRSYRQSLGK